MQKRRKQEKNCPNKLVVGKWTGPKAISNHPEIAAFDTEDNSRTGFISAAFVGNGRKEIFKDAEEVQRFLTENSFGRLQLWAHNLEYDLVNIFRGSLGALVWDYYGSRLLSARVCGTQTAFADSTNLVGRIPLAKAGEIIGLEKLPFDPNSEDYVFRDAEIVYRLMTGLRDYVDELGGCMKRTIAATALDLWAREYAEMPLPVIDEKVRQWFRNGYYGGRVEVFRYGKQKGKFSYVDINSLYPSVMRNAYPRIWDLRNGGANGIAKARVSVPSSLNIPPLPYRDESGRILYPVGGWTGYYCTNELEYARALGCKVKILELVGSDTMCHPFRHYVTDLYEMRKRAKGQEKTFLKILLNSLYGKFGSAGGEAKEIRPFHMIKGKFRPIDGTAGLIVKQTPPPKYGNIIWGAWTTAEARITLHKALMKVIDSGGEPMYCDTDSIVINGPCPFKDSKELGYWKLEDIFTTFHAKGPKMYHYRAKEKDSYKVKGVKRSEAKNMFETGYAEFKRPLRMRESMNRKDNIECDGKVLEGTAAANFWITQTKRDHKPEPRRNVKRGGLTTPPQIGKLELDTKRIKAKKKGVKNGNRRGNEAANSGTTKRTGSGKAGNKRSNKGTPKSRTGRKGSKRPGRKGQ